MIVNLNKIFAIFFIVIFLITQKQVFASEEINCKDRYATLVNPVRGRDLWYDKSLNPILDQYNLIENNGFSATWLVQDGVLKDTELLTSIRSFNPKQEIGGLLEISKDLADRAKVIYPYDAPWFSPRAVFLSGYSQSDRKRLIDTFFKKFKKSFGYFPRSVGAWWIDSYSLSYMRNKYHIVSAMIVADQKTTDNYGVWGQWWGVPYYPAKANILVPADINDQKDVVIIQWAQRHLLLSYGDGSKYSNYSLQANDYISQGENTAYFDSLIKNYLDCQNNVGQITVGLETGMESIGYLGEYKNQLELLKKYSVIKAVTMEKFAKQYRSINLKNPAKVVIQSEGYPWVLTPQSRSNSYLGDSIKYFQNIAFKDYFIADSDNFLNRRLPKNIYQRNDMVWPYFYFVSFYLILGVVSYKFKKINIWLVSLIFTFLSYWFLIKSYYQYGWRVYFGPVVGELPIIELLLFSLTYYFFWFVSRINYIKKRGFHTLALFIVMTFSADGILEHLRYSYISSVYYLGFMVDNLKFWGLSLSKNWEFGLVYRDFPAYQAASLLRFNFEKIWDNLFFALLLYPLIHVLFGILLFIFYKKLNKKLKLLLFFVLIFFLLVHMVNIFDSDPRRVVANN